MAIDLEKLATELAKEQYAALVADGDHAGIAALLNAKTQSVSRASLPQATVLVLSNTLKAKKIAMELAQPPVILPAPIVDIVDSLMPSVALQDSLDLTLSQVQAMLGVLKQVGLMTDDEVTTLTTTPASLAEAGGIVGTGEVVTSEQVTWCWPHPVNGPSPNSIPAGGQED